MSNNTPRSTDGFTRRTAATNKKITKLTMLGYLVLWSLALAVIGSIGFSSYMVLFGTEDSTAKLLILPQIIAAGMALIVLPVVAIAKLVNR